jgi:hypothetical protein
MIDATDLKHIGDALRDYPANGILDFNIKGHGLLLQHGLVEPRETKKRCQACGTERPDHHWHAISPAGRVLMAAMGIVHE